MNQLNENLRAVRTSKAIIRKKMEHSFEIRELIILDSQLNQLDKEEKQLLEQIGDVFE